MSLDNPNADAPPRGANPVAPHPTLEGYYDAEAQRPRYLRQLFDTSARHYDRISSVMSLGTDQWYRRRVLLETGLAPGMRLLDVACGTGLVARPGKEIVGSEGLVVGVEPSAGMLGEAVRQGRLNCAVRGIAEQLPLADDSFDMLSMGFALRHVADLLSTFREYARVLKPGGRVLILEITPPSSPALYKLFRFYLKSWVPMISRISTRSRTSRTLMTYCWDTHDQCVPPQTILDALRSAGFEQVRRRVQAGVFSEYTGRKPDAAPTMLRDAASASFAPSLRKPQNEEVNS